MSAANIRADPESSAMYCFAAFRASSCAAHRARDMRRLESRVKPAYDAAGERHACRLAQLFRVAGARPRMARPAGHPRHRSIGAYRHRAAAARRNAETLRRRGDLSAAVHFVHARRHRGIARSSAAARHRAGGLRLDHDRGAGADRPRLSRRRRRQILAGSVSRIDAAGGGLADDGRACAGGADGPRLDAGADHAGDRHRAGAADRAAVRLDVFRHAR